MSQNTNCERDLSMKYENHLVGLVILFSMLLAFYQRQAWCGLGILFLTIIYDQFKVVVIKYSDFKNSGNENRLRSIEQELVSINSLISFKNLRK